MAADGGAPPGHGRRLAILCGHQLNAERERSLEIEAGRPRAEREIQLEPRAEPKPPKTT